MKKILFIPIAALFASCSTTMYVPNMVNTPLLKEKGEVKINANNNNLQVAAAIGDNVGVMVNGFYDSYKGNNDYLHSGGLIEGAVGYYKAISPDVVFDAYGGLGMGQVYKRELMYAGSESYRASFNASGARLFLQPSIGYNSRFFDMALSSRTSFVKYTAFSSQNYSRADLEKDYLEDQRITQPVFVFMEPAVTVRGGYKWIKLQLQFGLTLNMTGENIRHPNSFSSLGLSIDIAKWYNR